MSAERQFFSVEDGLTIEKRWHLEEPTHLKSAQPLDFWRDRIDNDCHVFRIAESLHDIIVSASVRETLISTGVTGVTFHEV